MTHGDKSRLREQFIAYLLTEPTVYAAAEKAGIAQATATAWFKQPVFQAAYAEARQRALDDTVRYMKSSITIGVQKLRELVVCSESEHIQLGAAKALVEFGVRAWEMTQLLGRLTALEQKVLDHVPQI